MNKRRFKIFFVLMLALAVLTVPAAFADGEAEANAVSVPQSAEANAVVGGQLAKIGETYYETLDDAVAAAQSGDVIELLGNCTSGGMELDKSISIKGEYGITFAGRGIALKGAELTLDGCEVIMNGIGENAGEEHKQASISLDGNSALRLSSAVLSLDGAGTADGTDAIYCAGSSAIELNDSTVNAKNYPQAAIKWGGGSGECSVKAYSGSVLMLDGNGTGFSGAIKVSSVGSNVTVTNSKADASDGADFVFDGGSADFSGNAGNAISAESEISFKNGVDARFKNNGLCALSIASGKISVSADTTLEISGNGKTEAEKGGAARGAINIASEATLEVAPGAKLTISDNYVSAIRNAGAAIISSGSIMRNGLLIPYGGGLNNLGTATVAEGVALYNNHAQKAGDDIASSGILNLGSVGSGWRLDGTEGTNDCSNAIDAWYADGEGARWNAHSLAGLHVEKVEAGSVPAGTYLKAAHSIGTKEQHNTAELELAKLDSVTREPVKGAEFGLYADSACTSSVASGKTNADGLLKIGKLTPGTYYLKETKAPNGYKLNPNVYTVEVTEAQGEINTVVENGEALYVQEYDASAALLLNGEALPNADGKSYPEIADEPVASFVVRKVWVDNNVKTGRVPVELRLSANGKQLEKFELNEKNGWEKSFELEKYDADGKEIEYTVTELTEVKGYIVSYSEDTFTVYNTIESLKPKTGDGANPALYAALGLSALIAAAGVGIVLCRKSKGAV